MTRNAMDPRRAIGFAQDDAVMVEFIPALEIDATIGLVTNLMQADAVEVVNQRLAHVQNPDLNEPRSQYAFYCHVFKCPLVIGGLNWIGMDLESVALSGHDSAVHLAKHPQTDRAEWTDTASQHYAFTPLPRR